MSTSEPAYSGRQCCQKAGQYSRILKDFICFCLYTHQHFGAHILNILFSLFFQYKVSLVALAVLESAL